MRITLWMLGVSAIAALGAVVGCPAAVPSTEFADGGGSETAPAAPEPVNATEAGAVAVADAGVDADAGPGCIGEGIVSADKPVPGQDRPLVCCPGLHLEAWASVDERCNIFAPWGCFVGRCGDGVCEPWEGSPIPAWDGGQIVCGCANDCLPDGGSTGVVLDAGADADGG